MAKPHKSMRVPRSSAVSFNSSAILTIKVGPTASCQSFTVHESFLTARSEFFRRAMNGNWTESESRIIDLSDDEPEVFALYLNLIYKNVLPTMDLTEKEFGALPPVDIVMHIDKEYTTLFKLYILAEKLQDDLTKDEAITAVFQLSQVRAGRKICIEPAPETVKLVYNATPQCSPSRLLCVDIWKVGSRDLMEIWRMRFPKEFLFDLAMAYRHELLEASENVTNRKDVTAFLEATKKSQEQKTHPEGKSTSLKSP